jgi:DNA repair exonuclease SbcCD ATPase subunit
MLKQLEYSVTFPSTGRTFNEAVLFQGGFGAIVGPNESGKSLILEMIRFCLFGSAALRGKSEDYKNLKASLSFILKGSDYLVERTITKAKLTKDGEVIAVGVTPVNTKIPTELGFGLAVFDMACAANQDELLALGTMKPTDRRRAVDSVIGVSALDDLAKWAADEANALKRAADDLAANLHEPVEPTEPAGYQNSALLEEEKVRLDQVRSEADQLRGWLATEKQRPVKPEDKIGMGSAVIQDLLDQQTERRIQRQSLEAELARIPTAANVTLEEIEADEEKDRQNALFLARRKFLTYNQRPDLTQDQIDTLRLTWEAHHRWQKVQHLKQQRDDLLAKGRHTCPSCTHQWPIAGDALQAIEDELLTYSKAILLEEKPMTTEAEVEKQQRLLDAWDEAEWQKHANSPDKQVDVQWTVQDRVRHRHGLEGRARRAELQAQIEQLKPADKEPDYASMLRERQQYEAQLGVWSDKVAEYEAWEAERG